MTVQTNLLERTVTDLLREVLDAADDELTVVNPDAMTVEGLVDAMESGSLAARVLANERTLKNAMEDFKLASRAADLVEAGRLDLRAFEGEDNTLLVTPDSLVAVVQAGGRVAGLTTDDETFIERAYEQYDEAYATAEEFSLRTPAISRVRETLRESMGDATANDFDGVLASMETARGDGDGLDEVTVSLLVAAKNEQLLYDVSKWGEDVGIASKATFSRTKSRLEEAGLVETEKVPIDIGRPRLRLMLGDERLEGADVDELANVAQSVLTAS